MAVSQFATIYFFVFFFRFFLSTGYTGGCIAMKIVH